MKDRKTKEFEGMLEAYYRLTRTSSEPCDRIKLVETLVASIDTALTLTEKPTLIRFVSSQIRFMRPHVWVLNIALIVIMAVICLLEKGEGPLLLASSVFGAASVLVAVPSLLASKSSHMAELEYACRFDCGSVALARLIILGCSDVFMMTVAIIMVPILSGTDGFTVLLHACAPYFLACAGCLLAFRKVSTSGALMLSAAWIGGVMALSLTLYMTFPIAYSSASMGVWTLTAVMAFAWVAREAVAWLLCVSGGLDSPNAMATN